MVIDRLQSFQYLLDRTFFQTFLKVSLLSTCRIFENFSENSLTGYRSSRPEVFYKSCNFIKKETLAQVFSCGFCEISKVKSLYRTPQVTASEVSLLEQLGYLSCLMFHEQREPSEVFCKKSCSYKFRKLHRKTLEFESHFNQVAGLQAYFQENLQTLASMYSI